MFQRIELVLWHEIALFREQFLAGKRPSVDIGDPNFQYHFVLKVIIHVISVCADCPWIANDYAISTNR